MCSLLENITGEEQRGGSSVQSKITLCVLICVIPFFLDYKEAFPAPMLLADTFESARKFIMVSLKLLKTYSVHLTVFVVKLCQMVIYPSKNMETTITITKPWFILVRDTSQPNLELLV